MMMIMRLTCYVGSQIDSVTESSTVFQDTNLQFTENDSLSVIGAVKKQHAQHIQMADFFLLFLIVSFPFSALECFFIFFRNFN